MHNLAQPEAEEEPFPRPVVPQVTALEENSNQLAVAKAEVKDASRSSLEGRKWPGAGQRWPVYVNHCRICRNLLLSLTIPMGGKQSPMRPRLCMA
jgi:hypothetical protein